MYVWVCCCMQMWKESKGQQMVNGKKKTKTQTVLVQPVDMQLRRALACLRSQAFLNTFGISYLVTPLPLVLLCSWYFPLNFVGLTTV